MELGSIALVCKTEVACRQTTPGAHRYVSKAVGEFARDKVARK